MVIPQESIQNKFDYMEGSDSGLFHTLGKRAPSGIAGSNPAPSAKLFIKSICSDILPNPPYILQNDFFYKKIHLNLAFVIENIISRQSI